MKKLKLISLLCTIAMLIGCFAMFPVFATETPNTVDAAGNGSGTETDPYLLYKSNFADYYNNFSKYASKHVKMAEDITVNEGNATDWADGKNIPAAEVFGKWTGAMGNSTQSLTGSFDGAGHTLSGVCLIGAAGSANDGPWRRIALFAGVGGTLKNLKLVNSYFEANACAESNWNEAAAFASRVTGRISNCYTDAIIVNNDLGTSAIATGGIAGAFYAANATVERCVFNGTLSGNGYVGGIVGYNHGYDNSTISNCLNLGSIKSANKTYAGGIFGYMNGSHPINITNCMNISSDIADSDSSPSDMYGGGGNADVKVTNFISVEGFTTGYYGSGSGITHNAVIAAGWDKQISVITFEELLDPSIVMAAEGGKLAGWSSKKGYIPSPIIDDPATANVNEGYDISIGKLLPNISKDTLGLSTVGADSIRISSDNAGLRFETVVNSDMIAILRAAGATFTMDTYITVSSNISVEDFVFGDAEFTAESFDENGLKYAKASATEFLRTDDVDGYTAFAGSIVNIKDLNREYIAVGRLNITLDGATYSFYSNWNMEDVTSVSAVAYAVIADVKGASEEGYTNAVVAEDGTTVYSPYTQAEYDCIAGLIAKS